MEEITFRNCSNSKILTKISLIIFLILFFSTCTKVEKTQDLNPLESSGHKIFSIVGDWKTKLPVDSFDNDEVVTYSLGENGEFLLNRTDYNWNDSIGQWEFNLAQSTTGNDDLYFCEHGYLKYLIVHEEWLGWSYGGATLKYLLNEDSLVFLSTVTVKTGTSKELLGTWYESRMHDSVGVMVERIDSLIFKASGEFEDHYSNADTTQVNYSSFIDYGDYFERISSLNGSTLRFKYEIIDGKLYYYYEENESQGIVLYRD